MDTLNAEMWVSSLQGAYAHLLTNAADIVPKLVVGIIILFAGWAIGSLIGQAVARIVRAVKIDGVLQKAGATEALARAGIKLNAGKFVGALVRWFVITVFLVAVFDMLELTQVNEFLNDILAFLPKVIVAVLILFFGFVIADVVERMVEGSTRATGVAESSRTLALIARGSVLLFAFLIALDRIEIVDQFSQILFMGIVAMLALAGGLAFGLGGKEAAKAYIEKAQKGAAKKK